MMRRLNVGFAAGIIVGGFVVFAGMTFASRIATPSIEHDWCLLHFGNIEICHAFIRTLNRAEAAFELSKSCKEDVHKREKAVEDATRNHELPYADDVFPKCVEQEKSAYLAKSQASR